MWQVEAVFSNGLWHRFYGFVSDHSVRFAPETDIKTNLPSEWFINTSLQGFLQGSSTFARGAGGTIIPDIQTPVPLRIVLLNYASQSVPVPVPFSLGADPRTLPVSLSMLYRPLPTPSTYPPPNPWRFRPNPMGGIYPNLPFAPQEGETASTLLTLIPLPSISPTLSASPSSQTTTPTPMISSYGTVLLTEFNLRSLYDISKPGRYEFRIGGLQQSTNYIAYTFTVKD